MAYNLYERKMGDLLKLKTAIQKMEDEQKDKKEQWKQLGEEVRSLGQQIGDKKKELFDKIQL